MFFFIGTRRSAPTRRPARSSSTPRCDHRSGYSSSRASKPPTGVHFAGRRSACSHHFIGLGSPRTHSRPPAVANTSCCGTIEPIRPRNQRDATLIRTDTSHRSPPSSGKFSFSWILDLFINHHVFLHLLQQQGLVPTGMTSVGVVQPPPEAVRTRGARPYLRMTVGGRPRPSTTVMPASSSQTAVPMSQARRRSPSTESQLPSLIPPRKRLRLGRSPAPRHAPVIPEGAFGPTHLPQGSALVVLPPIPTPSALPEHPPIAALSPPSPSSSDVEIIEPPVVLRLRPTSGRARRDTKDTAPKKSTTRPKAPDAKPKPTTRTKPQGKPADKGKGHKAPATTYVRVRSPAPIRSSIDPGASFNDMLPSLDSPPYPCTQCAFRPSETIPCEFRGWDKVCLACTESHLKCSFVQKNNESLDYVVRERFGDQARGSPSGEFYPYRVRHFIIFIFTLLAICLRSDRHL